MKWPSKFHNVQQLLQYLPFIVFSAWGEWTNIAQTLPIKGKNKNYNKFFIHDGLYTNLVITVNNILMFLSI